MNNHCLPIFSFHDPFATCCFIDESWLFVAVYHNQSNEHHQFFYNWKTKETRRKSHMNLDDSSELNFPFRSFYSPAEGEVFTIYRSSLSIRTPVGNNLKDGAEDA